MDYKSGYLFRAISKWEGTEWVNSKGGLVTSRKGGAEGGRLLPDLSSLYLNSLMMLRALPSLSSVGNSIRITFLVMKKHLYKDLFDLP